MINEFALDLYAQLKNESGNIFFSPYSISCSLAIACAGAKGETASQMEKVLHLNDAGKKIHSLLCKSREEDSRQIITANALWGKKGCKLKREFVEFLKNQYQSECNQLDFINDPEGSRQTINNWIENKTNQKTRDMINEGVINSLTRMIFSNENYLRSAAWSNQFEKINLNVICFKAVWSSQFKKLNTEKAPFYETKDQPVNVPMMKQTMRFGYFEDREIKMLELPYKQKELSMFVILPKNIDGLKQIEKKLSAELINSWIKKTKNEEVEVFMPKFHFTSAFRIEEKLKTLGMRDAFSLEQADFSQITEEEKIFISEVFYIASINVNEEGIETAAANATIEPPAAPILQNQLKPKEFKADHPFLFFIRDNQSGCILFIGRAVKFNYDERN